MVKNNKFYVENIYMLCYSFLDKWGDYINNLVNLRLFSNDFKFKFRVVGLVRNGDKFLLQAINKSEFYTFPGGHVEIGESTKEAINRELHEEIPLSFHIGELKAIIQNIFTTRDGRLFHELGYYYEAEAVKGVSTSDFDAVENDKGYTKTFHYKWATIEEMKKMDVRPAVVIDLLERNEPGIKHIIYRNNTKVDEE